MIDPPTEPATLVEALGKWVALLASAVAAGQAVTVWLRGYWQANAEKEKSAKELTLAQLKERSDLAQQYLKVILDENTKQDGRAMLLSAVASIHGHPLQKWAEAQYKKDQRDLDKLLVDYRAQSDAAQLQDSLDRQVMRLKADIQTLNDQIELVRYDPKQRETWQDQRIAKASELGQILAKLHAAAAESSATAVLDSVGQGVSSSPLVKPVDPVDPVMAISSKITVELLKSIFPQEAPAEIEHAVPYFRAALQEFRISDKRLAASIIATISVETNSLAATEEPAQAGKAYENKIGLGNVQQDDGVRFRGRGYINLTGRTNYTRMSERLGLGTWLVDAPDDAKKPEIAFRLLVVWFADRRAKLSAALAENDFETVRRAVSGIPSQLNGFTSAYNKTLEQL